MSEKQVTVEQALKALDSLDDYARMNVGVDAYGARGMLERFIKQQAASPIAPVEDSSASTRPVALTCKACSTRVKDWNGSDPRCAFSSGVFSQDNWNCATLSRLRDLCYEGQPSMPPGISYQYCDDMKYATIAIDWIRQEASEEGEEQPYLGMALWISWYKSRGTTDALWLLSSDSPPRQPTEEEVLAVVTRYEALLSQGNAN